MNHRIVAILAACLLAGPAAAQKGAQSAQDKKDHEELRGLLQLFTQSFNSRDVDALTPYLHKDFTVTMVNQDLVTTPKELKGYIDKQFNGPGSVLKEVRISPEADVQTVILNGRFGINRGGSTDTYTLKDGRIFVIKTRWTGTVIKEDGKWKVLNAHIGLNPLDNPILDAAEKMRWLWAVGGTVLGLALGVLATLYARRRKKA